MHDEHPDVVDPYILRCIECHRLLDERLVTVWSKVTGWEKKRSQGGTNHVALREPLDEFMCVGCMDKLQRGVSTAQLELGAW